ncbi:LuxR C-terminal-related transcriptional regulator [Candidatus Rariloculus sp.]|uniref:helix-turn-helix transcriptional regulator n=1 Tax=Candidatus Rariloculus sp. TaxID=3101265 RepID=UPI003D0CF62D
MTSDDRTIESPGETGGESPALQAPPWLLRQRITLPDRVAGYVRRDELMDRSMPTQRRLTVLKASGGFGKTTLLAECCRSLRNEGVPAAWVSVDERDEPEALDTYIAFACHGAGLDLLDLSDLEEAGAELGSRVELVLRKIQSFGKPFVIAFDELERLENPASVALLEHLLQRGPPNLHLAVACRQIPDGLNVAGAALEGRAEVLASEDLRFSGADVARFFDLMLSRSELAEEIDRSAGWPLALRISRNSIERGPEAGAGIVKDFVRNWIETRLFADLGRDDRDFLLDLGLFDWIDAALLDEVLQRGDSMYRLESMGVLAGLLEPVSGGATRNWRLHPLVREYCARQRYRENPERFRAIRCRLAEALARRGETVPAMRHALVGGDPVLAGDLLEQAGGVRLWARQGAVQLQAANRLLSEEVISARPRLALVRCIVLALSGSLEEARKLYHDVSTTHPPRHRDEDDPDFEYLVDECIARGGLALYGGELGASKLMRTLSADIDRLVRSPRMDPLTRGQLEYARCGVHSLMGEFDAALERLAAVREFLANSQFIAMHGGILHGQVDMAQGRAQEAESHYRRARRIARKSFVLDPVPAAGCNLGLKELALECNRVPNSAEVGGVPRVLMNYGAPFSFFAMGSGVSIDLRLRAGQVEQALAVADEQMAFVRAGGLTSLVRYLAALRTSVLVIAGRLEDAGRAWRRDKLPEDSEGCVDLAGQTWREMEAVSCARLRWLIAMERFGEARGLARELSAVTAERGLTRTRMRGLALSVVLEQRGGEPEAAVAHLEQFLRLFAESPYAWPLVRERATCAAVVKRFLHRHRDSPRRKDARSLLTAMRRLDDGAEPVLSQRQKDVLRRSESQRDKQIAAELGLTVDGVRYHLRKVFAKLCVAKRADAVRRARELGLLADDA